MSRGAARAILKGMGKAALGAFIVDGAIGAHESYYAYTRGEIDARQALLHIAKEACTGAASAAAGVGLATGLAALTGGVAVPVMALVAAGGTYIT